MNMQRSIANQIALGRLSSKRHHFLIERTCLVHTESIHAVLFIGMVYRVNVGISLVGCQNDASHIPYNYQFSIILASILFPTRCKCRVVAYSDKH